MIVESQIGRNKTCLPYLSPLKSPDSSPERVHVIACCQCSLVHLHQSLTLFWVFLCTFHPSSSKVPTQGSELTGDVIDCKEKPVNWPPVCVINFWSFSVIAACFTPARPFLFRFCFSTTPKESVKRRDRELWPVRLRRGPKRKPFKKSEKIPIKRQNRFSMPGLIRDPDLTSKSADQENYGK